jgi:nitrogenase subunit NifH
MHVEKLLILTGHFGSGKSEFAVNLAEKLSDAGKRVVLVDIDVVNPYFCLRDLKSDLMIRGIQLIAGDPTLTNAELMILPPQVSGVFYRKNSHVIMDIGGDDAGAVVLGRYNAHLKDKPYAMLYVLNPCRPMTQNSDAVIDNLRRIEKSARLKATGLVANPNLSYETTAQDILKGVQKVYNIAKTLGLPVVYTAVREDLMDAVADKLPGEVFSVKIHMKPPWL